MKSRDSEDISLKREISLESLFCLLSNQTDLQDRIRRSIDSGKTSTLVANLAGFQCLIIDVLGF